MAVLSQEKIEKIELICGYAQFSTLTRTQLEGDFTDAVVERVDEILAELDVINEQIKDARADSYIKQTRGTTLNYRFHLRTLTASGYNLLLELGSILGITIMKNRYLTKSSPSVNYW